MSLDPNKWLVTIPKKKDPSDREIYSVDSNKWVDTIPKPKKTNKLGLYSIVVSFFIFGIVFVSVVKNQTRGLQKEINSLQASINIINSDLHKATLDYYVITSPENISKLAEEHLDDEFKTYKKSQINKLDNEKKAIQSKRKEKNILKEEIVKEIKKKKENLKKLKKLYSNPKEIPSEIKREVAKKISKTKEDINILYKDPKTTLAPEKLQRWGTIQIVKLFFGMPLIPGN